VLTKLAVLERLVLDHLRLGLPVQTVRDIDKHALRLLGSVRETRRGLRNFLNAWWSGDKKYLTNHPTTLAWYKKHTSISRETWELGISRKSGDDGVTVQIERDPLEILKLGTYTGTCLGIGGICSDSAVAALLNVNKKVLYARDRQGRIVARQLLAISDDDQLVCFSVYPVSAPAMVKSAFHDYDRALGRALGIPLYDPANAREEYYQISSVLSVYWWDDGSWDFKVDQ
jgi:hypothetical protein